MLEKITRIDQKVKILCVLLSHELLSKKIIRHTIYIFYISYSSRQIQNPKIIKIQQVHQKLSTNQV